MIFKNSSCVPTRPWMERPGQVRFQPLGPTVQLERLTFVSLRFSSLPEDAWPDLRSGD
jgi:hypothetical protein